MADEWIDVSVSLHTGMVHWPDNPPVSIEREMSMERGDVYNVSKMSMGVHTGTHMDAPIHFIRGGIGIDQMPLTAAIGRTRVIEIGDSVSIKPDELAGHIIQRGERILFKTRNSARCWQTGDFVEDFVYIAHEAAQYLASIGVQMVGVDYLSVGGYSVDGPETHQALLGGGVWIIEGLNLAQVEPGIYDLICLPLRIIGGDGAPARAILRRVGSAS
ncbi:MAG TPA: cyclase family protein [Ktedonobacterales bacterium]